MKVDRSVVKKMAIMLRKEEIIMKNYFPSPKESQHTPVFVFWSQIALYTNLG